MNKTIDSFMTAILHIFNGCSNLIMVEHYAPYNVAYAPKKLIPTAI